MIRFFRNRYRGVFKSMKSRSRLFVLYVLMTLMFYIIFNIGIINNPNFDVFDFFLGLSTEMIGMILTVVIVESYMRERDKVYKDEQKKKEQTRENQETGDM